MSVLIKKFISFLHLVLTRFFRVERRKKEKRREEKRRREEEKKRREVNA